MKVKELIDVLSRMPQDLEVSYVYNYGDYWRTDVASPAEHVEIGRVVDSAYHQMDKVVDENNDSDEEDGEEVRTVVLIS